MRAAALILPLLLFGCNESCERIAVEADVIDRVYNESYSYSGMCLGFTLAGDVTYSQCVKVQPEEYKLHIRYQYPVSRTDSKTVKEWVGVNKSVHDASPITHPKVICPHYD